MSVPARSACRRHHLVVLVMFLQLRQLVDFYQIIQLRAEMFIEHIYLLVMRILRLLN